jgi:hypothetical protein
LRLGTRVTSEVEIAPRTDPHRRIRRRLRTAHQLKGHHDEIDANAAFIAVRHVANLRDDHCDR